MKKRYITFFDKEREIVSDLPWGDDNLVVVLASDTKRLERARFEFNERQAKLLMATQRTRYNDAEKLRDLKSLIIGIRPTPIPPKPLVTAPDVNPAVTRAPPKRPVPKRPS